MMSEFSFWGQTAIMVQKLQRQAKHYESLAVGAMRTVNIIEKAIEKLQAELDKCMEARDALQNLYDLSGRKRDQEVSLMGQISAMQADPSIAAATAAITAAERKRSSSSPSIPIPLRSTPLPSSEFISSATLTARETIEDEADVEFEFNQTNTDSDEEDEEKAKEEHIKNILGL
jgi:hypothetical protein